MRTCFNCDLVSTVSWFKLAFDLTFLVFFVFADASAAKSLKLINWLENKILPNEDAANWFEDFFAWSIKLTCWLVAVVLVLDAVVVALKKWFALLDDAVDVDDETEDDSNAAGVSSNGNVVGDNSGSDDVDVDDFDEVDDEVDDDRDDLDERVDAADDEEWCDEDDVYLLLANSLSLFVNVKWFGLKIKFEPDSPK